MLNTPANLKQKHEEDTDSDFFKTDSEFFMIFLLDQFSRKKKLVTENNWSARENLLLTLNYVKNISLLTKLVIQMLSNNVISNARQIMRRLEIDSCSNTPHRYTIPITCGIVNSIKDFMTKGKKSLGQIQKESQRKL